jgi:hypothetical protein
MELGDTLRRNAEEDGVDGPELKFDIFLELPPISHLLILPYHLQIRCRT